MITYYSYRELLTKAMRVDATQQDLENLANWFRWYDLSDWMGIGYKLENGYMLCPLFDDESEDAVIVGYEIRRD